MTASQHFARIIIEQVLTHGVPHYHLLNVNIPALPVEEIKGYKICRQARQARWQETFFERQDPHGRNYYWLTGDFVYADTR